MILRDAESAPESTKVVVYLGDYVDRGPDPCALVAQLIQTPLPGFECHHLLGNHEEFLLRYLDQPQDPWSWMLNGGEATLRSYGVDVASALARHNGGHGDPEALHRSFCKRLPRTHLDFYRALALSHEEGDYLFAHAGVHPARTLAAQRRQDLLWIREPFLDYAAPLAKVIVHGHTPGDEPVVRINRIGIDTGACYGGLLTALVMTGERHYFLQA
jgi:serine/threonine protein phosphatase 1